MASKQNDLMLNILANPQFTIEDFLKVGLSADNTSLEDENTYLNSEIITSNPMFQNESGEFDKVKFHNIYLNAAKGMYSMNTNPQNFEAVYSKYNVFAPVNLRENSPQYELTKINNPDRLTKSMLAIGLNGPREFTPLEIAQSLKVKNSETGELMDTPEDMFSFGKLFNDFTGFFSDNFGTTKVMALYEEDVDINGKKRGEIGFDENLIEHYKGDYMLNENGTYYYRTLKDGENIYGKQVLHYSDILTNENSALNSIDFLDSDDIQKSPFGTFIKDASLIGAMFIPGSVGATIAGATIFQQAAGLGATLGKIALGSDSKTMNWLEGLVEATNPMNTRSEWAQIDYGNTGRNTTWTIENLLGMVGDVVGQLRQQRLLFQYAPTILKGKWGINEKNLKLLEEKYLEELNKATKLDILSKYDPTKDPLLYALAQAKVASRNATKAASMVEDFMKSYNKSGEELSKAYMTLLTVNDIYGEAKEAGADDFDAALVTAGYAAMEYALLSTDIGKWILPELRGERLQNKAMVRALTKDVRESFRQLGKAAGESDEAKRTYLLRLVDFGKSVAKGEFNVGLGKRAAFKDGEGLMKAGFGSLMAGATAEAVEETSEELLADFSRVLYNGLQSLQGKDDTKMKPFENIFDRYAMSFLGGFIGGGVSSAAFDVNLARKASKMSYNEAMLHLIYKAHNNDLDGIYKILEKEEVGNKNLSATRYDKDEKGNVIWKQGDENDNLDLAIKNAAKRLINLIVNTLNAHGGKTDDELIDAQLLKDLRYRALRNTTTAGLFMLKYNETLTELVKTVNELNSLDTPAVKAENNDGDLKDNKNEESELQRKKLSEKIKELDKKLEEFHSGAKAPLFMATALIESTSYISKSLMTSTFRTFVEHETNTPFEKVSKNELERLLAQYNEYLKTNKKDDLQLATKKYLIMSSLIKENLEAAQKAIQDLASNPELNRMLLDITKTLGDLNFETDGDKWQESFGKWAASNSFKVGGMSIEDLINLVRNTFKQNESEINSDYENAVNALNLSLDVITTEKNAKVTQLEDSANLGELVDEETKLLLLNEIAKLDEEYSKEKTNIDNKTKELQEAKDKALEDNRNELKRNVDNLVQNITLKQANALADKILEDGFINGAVKNQVIDKLISLSRTISNTKKSILKDFKEKLELAGQDYLFIVDYLNLNPDLTFESAAIEIGFDSTPFIEDYNRLQQYQTAEQELNTKIEQIKQLGYTPVMDNLDAFALNSGKIKISQLLDLLGKRLSDTRLNVLAFTMDNQIYHQINEAERVIDLYLTALEGARVDNIDPIKVGLDLQGGISDTSNVWGINKVLNEVHTKAPKLENDPWVDLPEIEGMSADMMIEDVRRIKRVLSSYKTLYSINQGLKLNAQSRVSNKTIYLLYDRLNRLLTNAELPDKEKIVGVLSNLTLLRDLTSKDINEWNTSLSKEQLKQLEAERMLMEDAIFDYFQDKLDNIDQLKKIFSISNFKLSETNASLLTEGTDYIDDVSFLGYLAAKACIKTSSFLKLFKEIYKDGDIAPITGQEIAVQLGLANILNGNAITNINKAIRTSLLEMDKESLKKFLKEVGETDNIIEALTEAESGIKLLINSDYIPQYDNITFIEGVAGSGKSGAVDKLIIKYLNRYYPSLLESTWVTHGGDNEGGAITKEFGENIGVNPELCFDKVQLLLKIFDNYTESKENTLEYDENLYEIDANGKILPLWKTKKDVVAPKILFIDEMQQFTQLELLALDKWAQENGVSIIGSGDLSLSQKIGIIDLETITKEIKDQLGRDAVDSKVPVILTRNLVLHTPKLGTSMRTANNLKNINMTNTQAVQIAGLGNIQLHHYEDDTTLAGDMRISATNRGEILKYLDKMIALANGKKVDIIYIENPDRKENLKTFIEKHAKYKDKINFHANTALGLEGDFWIAEIPATNLTKFLLDFYTGQTRGKIFTLMLCPESVGSITISNVLDLESHKEEYDKNAVKKFANDKVAILEEVVPKDAEDIPYKARNTEEHKPIERAVKPPVIVKKESSEEKRRRLLESLASEGNLEFDEEEPNTPPSTPPPSNTPSIDGYEGPEPVFPPIDLFIEEDEVPIEDIDVENENLDEEEIKDKLDLENGLSVRTEPIITDEETSSGMFSTKGFKFKLFSNASFEVGGIVDENGMIGRSEMIYGEFRIDGINGIFDPSITGRLWIALLQEAAANDGKVSVQNLELNLGRLRRILLGINDKSMMEKLIANDLGIELAFVRFAVKTSSFDTDFVTEPFGKLEKEKAELLRHARAQVNPKSDSNKVNNRFLVAIIGTNDGVKHDIIEIPLLNFNNPVTLIRRLDPTTSFIRQRFEYYFNNYTGSYGEKLIYALSKLLDDELTLNIKGKLSYKPEYAGLANLIKQYLTTYRNIVFVKNKTWTPSKNLDKLGIQFNIERGQTNYDDVDYILTKEWMSLDELKADPSFARISKPLQLKSRTESIVVIDENTGEEVAVHIGNPKHPFVLVSDTDYDHNGLEIVNDKMLMDEFIYQQGAKGVPKTIQLVYIIPPKFTLKEYLTSLSKFMTGESKASPLGNLRTAYKILESLFTATIDNPQRLIDCFTNALGKEDGTALYNRTKKTIFKLLKMNNVSELIKYLTGTSEIWNEGIPLNIPVYRLLQNVLKQLIRPQKVAIEINEEGIPRIYIDHKGTEADFERLFNPLNEIFEESGTTLHYQVRGNVSLASGIFIPIQVDENGYINDDAISEKEFTITGSIASSAFVVNENFNDMMDAFNKERVEHQNKKQGSFITTESNKAYIPGYYTVDGDYQQPTGEPGYSGWNIYDRTKPSGKLPPTPSVDSKILNKLKNTLSKEIYDSLVSKLTPIVKDDKSPQLLALIAYLINSDKHSTKAIVIKDNLVLCSDSFFEGKDVIFGDSRQNGPNLLIPVSINGKKYDGTYYNGTFKILEVIEPTESVESFEGDIIEITPELVNLNRARYDALMKDMEENEGILLGISEDEWNFIFELRDSDEGIAEIVNMYMEELQNSGILNKYTDLLDTTKPATKGCGEERTFKFM